MIVETKFVKRAICPCGYSILMDEIPLGAVYQVDPARTSIGTLYCGGCGKRTDNLKLIWAEGNDSGNAGWLPVEIFDIARVN